MRHKATMRNGLIRRRPGAPWTVVFDGPDGRQKWVRLSPTIKKRGDAAAVRRKLMTQVDEGEYIERHKTTVGAWLDTWVEEQVRPPQKAITTYVGYRSIIDLHLKPALGNIALRALSFTHVEKYLAERTRKLAGRSLRLHLTVLTRALRVAVKRKLIAQNPVTFVDNRPKPDPVPMNCWTVDEARRAIAAAKRLDPQIAALLAVLLDSGVRKGELLALAWDDVDLDAGMITIRRTLLRVSRKNREALGLGHEPLFGEPKTKRVRKVLVSDETVTLLRKHRLAQNQLKMKNRAHYRDLGLVFSKGWPDLHGRKDRLGEPLCPETIMGREFARVIKAAGVRRITPHGCRHTAATMLIAAGEPAVAVADRLGHSRTSMTSDVYTHALESHKVKAARTSGALLYGKEKKAQ